MPRGRKPEGQAALTNAERQARHRAPAAGIATAPTTVVPVGAAKPDETLERRTSRDDRGSVRVRRVVRGPV